MKKLLTAFILASALPLTAAAGCSDCKKHSDPAEKLAHLTEALELTAEQQEKVKAVLEEKHAKKEALKKKYKLEAYYKKKNAIKEKSKKDLDALLTEEQKGKLQQCHSKKGKKGKKEKNMSPAK